MAHGSDESTRVSKDAAIGGAGAIRAAFARARSEGRGALMPFVTAGYPDPATTERVLAGIDAAGADLVEIGFPFSDPIADGPVIAESMHHALLAGTTPARVFELVARLKLRAPILAMVSVSIVERIGAERFIEQAVSAGFAGFIVPDADPADASRLSALAAARGAGYCALVSPTTPVDRLSTLAGVSTGFVYLLARAGVTGERNDAPEIDARVRAIRAVSSAPIAAGFGISTRAHVEAVARQADGAIVGSAIVRRMTEAKRAGADVADAALSAIRELRG
ncbi:MAG: tryptophan synthase subunit alpha [Planctomycetaceae bacterium]|nr:tryptophan synthase subunit alpha [Planctomycetaceae bacterium]